MAKAKLVKSDIHEWKVTDNNNPLGIIYRDEGGFMFRPEIDNGVEHTSDHLREIADLMDALEAERAKAAAGK
jgi:hypothetical protein